MRRLGKCHFDAAGAVVSAPVADFRHRAAFADRNFGRLDVRRFASVFHAGRARPGRCWKDHRVAVRALDHEPESGECVD